MRTLQTPLNLALAAYLLPHAETLEQETTAIENVNVSGASITLTAGSGEIGDSGVPELYDLSTTGSIDDLSVEQRKVLSTASPADIVGRSFNRYSYVGSSDLTQTDLEDLDFSDTDRWQKLTIDHLSETERDGTNFVNLATNDRVLIQFTSLEYGVYVYQGAGGSENLSITNLNDTALWQKEAIAAATTTDGERTFTSGDIVEDRFTLHSLVVHMRGDVNTASTAGTTVSASGDIAVEGSDNLRIESAESTSGNIYLRAVNDILTNEGVTLLSSNRLQLQAGGDVQDVDGDALALLTIWMPVVFCMPQQTVTSILSPPTPC